MPWFDTYGPLNVEKSNAASAAVRRAFWEAAETHEDDVDSLRYAIGCYMFCLKFGSTITPWYVGMTIAQGGFDGEIFQPHKLEIYDSVWSKRKGTPVIFLFPMISDEGHLFSKARTTKKKVIEQLEQSLMGMAFARNADISNVRGMDFLRNIEVTGVMGPKYEGRPYREVSAVRKALFG